ncbi:MAG: membrane dipeptidase [Bacteroidetes bacterium]|nr:membrane dipeptidase [Bacteroidota bacterium]
MRRRQFLQSSGLLAGALLLPNDYLWSHGKLADGDYLTFDFHAHPGAFYARNTPEDPGAAMLTSTLNAMKTGKLSGAFFSLVADMKVLQRTPTGIKPNGNYAKGEGWLEYKRQLNLLSEIWKANGIIQARKASDLDMAFKTGKTAAFISVEGGDSLEGDAGKLEEMYQDGVRSVQIVHYHPNELGDLQTEVPQHNGLSPEGKEAIRRMNKLKILIDLAHATYETTKAVAGMTDAPLLLSHSILQMEGDRPLAKRTITAEHAKVIASTGGVIGAWPSGFNKNFDEFIDNIKRLIDAAGIDHVGLGTDMDGNFKPVLASYDELPKWIGALKAKGLSDEEARKVAGGNAKRLLAKVVG